MTSLTPNTLKPYLVQCGYVVGLVRADVAIPHTEKRAVVGFFERPLDARSACIAVVREDIDPAGTANQCRILGAPVLLILVGETMEVWKQRPRDSERIDVVPQTDIPHFFEKWQTDLSPESVYRAKTRSRFETGYQLSFVDGGLMPVVETEIGKELSRLVERSILSLRNELGRENISSERGRWIFQAVFWLLAAKILHDKKVDSFQGIDLRNPVIAFAAVSKHYHDAPPPGVRNRREHAAIEKAADRIATFSSLAHVTTEALACLYESTLISRETRQELGTHSTPTYLVDYIVAKLAPFVEQIAPDQRHVFEPACGHAGFLVSAMRLLRSLVPGYSTEKQRKYLRRMLHGVEKDAFALEIATLSLTLADVPNPNGWDLHNADVFHGNLLRQLAAHSPIFLSNPPFEAFSEEERAEAKRRAEPFAFRTKPAELIGRVLPELPVGSVIGVIVPASFLESRDARTIRELIATQFRIEEITLFPDKVFTFSDAESAVIIGQKTGSPPARNWTLRYRRVREPDIESFRNDYRATSDRRVPQVRFSADNDWSMRVAELESVWTCCARYSKLLELADVGKGLVYESEDLPAGAITYADSPFPGAVPGFVQFECEYLHQLPPRKWLNTASTVVDQRRAGLPTNSPQVLLNYAPVSRGPWRLRALLDSGGHAVTSRFITIRPKDPSSFPAQFFWAILNSPLANAYAFCHLGKRDNLVGTIQAIPMPPLLGGNMENIIKAADRYLRDVESFDRDHSEEALARSRASLMRLDAEVLRLYELPPRSERELLDLFAGYLRTGVPFPFDRYYEEGFRPCIPLALYISESYTKTTAERLRLRYTTTPKVVLNALGSDDE